MREISKKKETFQIFIDQMKVTINYIQLLMNIIIIIHQTMINKTFKGFLQYKIAHPSSNTDQTLLKLKALQKSRQKSKQKSREKTKEKRNVNSQNKKYSESFAETTQSTCNQTKAVDKKEFQSINNQIRNLQQKVQILLLEKSRQKSPGASKRSFNNSKSKQKSFTQKDYLSPICKELKNERLRNSFLNTYDSSRSMKLQQGFETHRYLANVKKQSSKLLNNVNIPQSKGIFDDLDSIESIFNTLQSIINIHINKKIKQKQQQERTHSQNKLKCLQAQIELSRCQENKLQNNINQLQKERKNLQERSIILNKKLQDQETQIYQLKVLYSQSENKLLKQGKEHQSEQENTLTKMRLQYEKRIYRQINSMQKQQLFHTKLKSIINEESTKNKELEISHRMLMDQIEKWEKQYSLLMERYNIERLEKNNLQEERNFQYNTYNQYKTLANQGYLNLIQKFNTQINTLRSNSSIQTQQIKTLKAIIKSYENKIKEVESDFLSLNHDYTRDVREWASKQENYEQNIRQLRNQVQQAHQAIAQYSKMLARSAGKSCSILDISEHD